MCSYSMIHDAMSAWHPPQDAWWTRTRLTEYQEVIRRLKEFDDKLGLPDCNPSKGDFMEEINRRLTAIEKKIAEGKGQT